MFERKQFPNPGSSLPDWAWKTPTVWTWITDAIGLVCALTLGGLGIWGLLHFIGLASGVSP